MQLGNIPREGKGSVQELPLHGTHSGGQEWVPTHGKGGPKDHVEADLKGRNGSEVGFNEQEELNQWGERQTFRGGKGR